ncbi:MAG TPA: DUF6152 family protein [Bryobacteraceae bacterium]|jgi:hypothetical protein
MRYVATILVFVAMPLAAHHSTAAEYDLSRVTIIQGVVTKVEWLNPHARFWLDVEGAAGSTIQWNVEMGSPNGLMRLGWTRSTIKPGDRITVDVSPAKDGTHHANARSVTLADGRVMSCGACGAMWALPLH